MQSPAPAARGGVTPGAADAAGSPAPWAADSPAAWGAADGVAPAASPAPSSYTVDESWGLVAQGAGGGEVPQGPGALDASSFRDNFLESAVKLMKDYGGPVQYLQQRFDTVEKKQEYVDALWKKFPALDTAPPCLTNDLPCAPASSRSDAPPLIMHLATLGFEAASCLAELPKIRTCMQLWDEIATDGFVTEGDPLVLSHKPEQQLERGLCEGMPWMRARGGSASSTLPGLSVAYIKGMTRVSALHILVSMCLDDGVDLANALLLAGWPCLRVAWYALLCILGV